MDDLSRRWFLSPLTNLPFTSLRRPLTSFLCPLTSVLSSAIDGDGDGPLTSLLGSKSQPFMPAQKPAIFLNLFTNLSSPHTRLSKFAYKLSMSAYKNFIWTCIRVNKLS